MSTFLEFGDTALKEFQRFSATGFGTLSLKCSNGMPLAGRFQIEDFTTRYVYIAPPGSCAPRAVQVSHLENPQLSATLPVR